MKVKTKEMCNTDYSAEIRAGISSWDNGSNNSHSIKYTWFDKRGHVCRGGEVPVEALPQMAQVAIKNGYLQSRDFDRIGIGFGGLFDVCEEGVGMCNCFAAHYCPLEKLLKRSLCIVSNRTRHPLQEPDYTVALAVEFPKLMQRTCVNSKVKFGGCYIHQSPWYAQIYNGKNVYCELGDLLVLCRRRVDGLDRFNAALFQLKRGEISEFIPQLEKELIQLRIYNSWPELSMGKKVLPDGYVVRPATVGPGAQYMFIHEGCYPLFTTAIPGRRMCANGPSFSRFLCDFMNWKTGRPISIHDAKNEDEWSRLIWDLLDDIEVSVFTRTNSGYTKHKKGDRRNCDFLNFMCTADAMKISDGTVEEMLKSTGAMRDDECERGLGVLFVDYGGEADDARNERTEIG